jgi:hypothetical protein
VQVAATLSENRQLDRCYRRSSAESTIHDNSQIMMMLACPEIEFVVNKLKQICFRAKIFSCDFLFPQRCYFLGVGSV